ncbi:MAG: NAD(P)/FAD-dependent oxidoreductase [Clostridia bacterium]|nr:NAD(P)/FAD-dependent oxidoreductase [Clostridia bacterium]
MKKIIVAGAGHGGIAAAALLAKQGYDVTVLELKKRAEMGHDWHDVMAKSSFEDAGFTRPEDGRFIPYTNTSYVAPSQKTEIAEPYKVSEWSGYIDRKELLKHLIGEAEKAGVAFRFGVKVVSVACDCEKVTGVRVLERGKIKEYAGDLVIDAAGIDSPVRRTLPGTFGVKNEISPKETFYTWRGYFENTEKKLTDPTNRVFFYHNNRPGMDWAITDEKFVDILVGGFRPIDQKDVDLALEDFRRQYPYMGKMIRGGQFVKIPLRRTLPVIVANGYAAVGDSAAMTEPLSGSGISLSLRAGKNLADAVIAAGEDALTVEKLWPYEYNYYQEQGNRQISNDVIKSILNSLTGRDVDFLLDSRILTLKEIASGGVPQYKAKELLEKLNLIKKPKIIPGMARALSHLTQIDAVCAKMPETYDAHKVAVWKKAYEAL